jgi:predicted ATP-dependent serine protease
MPGARDAAATKDAAGRRLRLHTTAYMCERCGARQEYHHYVGRTPRYCPDCRAERDAERAEADRAAARERSRRRRMLIKEDQVEREAVAPPTF